MTVEIQVLLTIFSGTAVAGIAYGMFQGTIKQFKETTESRLDNVEKDIALKRNVPDCIAVRGQCREELFNVLADLKNGQALVINHLLAHKNGQSFERSSDEEAL